MRESLNKYISGALDRSRKADPRPLGSDSVHQLLRGAILVALALGPVLYFVGLLEGRGELETLRAHNEKQLRRVQLQTDRLQTQLVSQEAFSQLLAARGWLYRSIIELDQSNIGLANRDIMTAGSILRTVHPVLVSTDPARIKALKEEIETMTISETADRHTLRRRILRWIEQTDALLPRQAAHVDIR
jgi:hypothetical protein